MSQPPEPEAAAPPRPSVVVVEAGPESLLLGWDEVADAVAYELQMGSVVRDMG